MRTLVLVSLPLFVALVVAACVGEDSSATSPDGDGGAGSDGSTSSDGGTNEDGNASDATAGPPPCGYPGELCCEAPAVPCRTGTTCSSGTPKRCLVNEVMAIGTYGALTNGNLPFVNRIVTMKYDGATWTEGPRIDTTDNWVPDGLGVRGPGEYRMVRNQSGNGQYWFIEGVNWKDCSGPGNCLGPTGTVANLYAVTAVNDNFWLGGFNVFYRCVAPNRCVMQTTGLGGQSWGVGNFTGPSEQDLWYSGLTKAFHFDGTTWKVHNDLKANTIYQVRKDDVWVASTTFQHWNGTAWSGEMNVEGLPAPGAIHSIGGGDPKNLLAIGESASGGFVLRYNGTEWKKDASFPTTLTEPADLYAPSSVEAFTGGNEASSTTGAIYVWNGTTWNKATLPALNTPNTETDKTVRWRHFAGPARPRP